MSSSEDEIIHDDSEISDDDNAANAIASLFDITISDQPSELTAVVEENYDSHPVYGQGVVMPVIEGPILLDSIDRFENDITLDEYDASYRPTLQSIRAK